MFHLGWFVGKGYSVHGWNQPYSGTIGTDWIKPDLYIDLAKALDRACFDYMLIEDGSFVSDAYQGSSDYYLRNAYAVPKADPVPLTPLIAYFTKRVGIIPTVTTSFYPPFLAARMGATLDHLTNGRLGLNIVTAHNDRSAQNYGLERHYEHDLRYEMAAEWMQIANALWTSWQPGAVQRTPKPASSPTLRKSRRSISRAASTNAAVRSTSPLARKAAPSSPRPAAPPPAWPSPPGMPIPRSPSCARSTPPRPSAAR
jgi:alkanesulfonate monooxygenase SsuD/methylene tetrahydromethanopterin reductase-like flavin-dependent oxidoreductase (luciferase family)